MPTPGGYRIYSTVAHIDGERHKAFVLATDGQRAAKFFAAAGVLDVKTIQNVRKMELREGGKSRYYFNVFGLDERGQPTVSVITNEGPAIPGIVFTSVTSTTEVPDED
jgi:hypothetical protein